MAWNLFQQSTMRLSAAIHYLEQRYDWTINRRKIATGTNDGRVAEISAYWLPQATIAQAFAVGAGDWVEGVKVARAERRKQSGKCKSDAAKINARKHFKNHDRDKMNCGRQHEARRYPDKPHPS